MSERVKIVDVGVDILDRKEAVKQIVAMMEKKFSGLKHVVTLYSEFVVHAHNDPLFCEVVNRADLVVPDGVGVLMANELGKKGKRGVKKVLTAFGAVKKGMSGKIGETVTGVYLFEKLIEQAAMKKRKVFLLGGHESVTADLVKRLKDTYLDLLIQFDSGEPIVGFDSVKNEEVIRKINEFQPDVLFVAYGPVKQEKWIYTNKEKLKAKVAIGVGGTFDELTGRVPRVPEFFEKRGMKSLWRLIVQPSRWRRMWRAWIEYPWLVISK